MTALAAPLLASLVGAALLRPLARGWTRPAFTGAALVLGPPLTTLLVFAAGLPGLPLGLPLLLGVVLAAGAVSLATRRRWPPLADLPARAWVPAALMAAAVLVLHATRVWDRAGPEGDGLFNFAVKARAIAELGTPWPLLEHPRAQVIHPDYPLHQPLVMDLGYWCSHVGGLQALLGDLLMLPGLVLACGALAGRAHPLAGAMAALAVAACGPLRSFAAAGYADPALAGAFALGAWGLAAGAGPVAGVAAGLLPWIKLEGLPLALGLVLLAGLPALGRRRPPWGFILPALVLGTVWPAVLAVRDLAGPATELPSALGGERLMEVAAAFGARIQEPGGPFRGLLAGVLAAAIWACLRPGSPGLRKPAMLLLAGFLAYPLAVFLRGTAIQHLQADGDVPDRLYLHLVPLGALVLARVLVPGVKTRGETL